MTSKLFNKTIQAIQNSDADENTKKQCTVHMRKAAKSRNPWDIAEHISSAQQLYEDDTGISEGSPDWAMQYMMDCQPQNIS